MQRWILYIALVSSVAVILPAGARATEVASQEMLPSDVETFPTLLPRVFISGNNSTLIPISSTTSLIVSAVAIVGLVLGAIFIFSALFTPGIHGAAAPFAGLLGPGPAYGSQYYQQPQQQAYTYEPYSKLGTYPNQFQNVQSRSSVEADSWPSLKILEYIAKMEETWNQLDVNDPECRKRVVCELHRNERHLGQTVSKFIKVFGYTRYLSLLSVPEEMKEMLQELHDAGDRGRSASTTPCKEIYTGCPFSVEETFLNGASIVD